MPPRLLVLFCSVSTCPRLSAGTLDSLHRIRSHCFWSVVILCAIASLRLGVLAWIACFGFNAKAQRRERRKEDYYFLEPGFKNHKSHETKKRERAGRALSRDPIVRRRCHPSSGALFVRLDMPAIIRRHVRFAPPHSRVPQSRFCLLPEIIIMESRMDANATKRTKQKKKSASRAVAAYPHEPLGGRFPVILSSGADAAWVCCNRSLAAPPVTSAGTLDSPHRIREGAAISMPHASHNHHHGLTNRCECHKPLEAKKEKCEPGGRCISACDASSGGRSDHNTLTFD